MVKDNTPNKKVACSVSEATPRLIRTRPGSRTWLWWVSLPTKGSQPISSHNPQLQISFKMSFTTEHDEIIAEIPSYIRVFKNGIVERPRQTPFVPPSIHDGISSKDVVISDDPSISARIYLPKSPDSHHKKLPILVYFHGGGFFFESAFSHQHHHYFTVFVSQVNAVVVSVEYRLAPEHHLPAAYDDCWDALKWVARCSTKCPNEEPWLKFGDSDEIFIGGDSAGGNIVHTIAMRAGVEDLPGGVKILGAIYGHPFFYGSKPIGSEPKEGHDEQSPAYLCWKLVYPCAPGGIDNPMMNPLSDGAPSLSGLGCGKILVCVAGKDGLRDRGVWYYEGVKNSGWRGKLELFEEEEEDHVYHIYDPESENSKIMMKRIASFMMEK